MIQLDFGGSFDNGSGGVYVPFDSEDFAKEAEQEAKTKFSSTTALVRHLKAVDQDFEYYPTTPGILSCIREDMLNYSSSRDDEGWPNCSVLDIGAGTGSALSQLTKGPKLAIELSSALVEQMPADIFVVGSDFNSQSLLDKRSDVTFTNPPYKQFEPWSCRVIEEANSSVIYLVIPERWEQSSDIANAIKARKATSEVIGKFDFNDAERKARCNVHVVKIELRHKYNHDRGFEYSRGPAVDAFDHWFENVFMTTVTPDRSADYLNRMAQMDETEKLKSNSALVESNGLINILSSLYDRELSQLMELYKGIMALPTDIVKELDIEKSNVKQALQTKVQGLKAKYWKELFDRLDTITSRLTSTHRHKMLDKLHSNTSVDFSVANAHSIVLWVIKQADLHVDSQLIELVETMTEEANVQLYKRNQNTIKLSKWRYDRVINIGAYKLDYSFILHDVGARSTRGHQLLNDIITVAITLGYDAYGNVKAEKNCAGGGAENYYFQCRKSGKKEILFTARRYQNGNIHIKLNSSFLMKLNCKFGQLKGWLQSVEDVVEEMSVTPKEAVEYFDFSLKLGLTPEPFLLLTQAAA